MNKNQINNYTWGVVALLLVLCLSIGIVGGLAYYSTTFAPSLLEQTQEVAPLTQPKTADESSDCCGKLQQTATTVAAERATHTATIGINVYYQLLLNCSIVNENFIRIVYLSFLLIGKL